MKDFLASIGIHTAEWPSFNVADSTLLVGVVIFFIVSTREERAAKRAAAEAGAPEAQVE